MNFPLELEYKINNTNYNFSIKDKNEIEKKFPPNDDTILIVATKHSDIDTIKFLLKNNASPNSLNKNRQSPLMFACNSGRLDIVKLLVENNADVNCKDTNQETALVIAVEKDYIDIVDYLIKNKADINVKDNIIGITPLMLASENSNIDILKLLLDAGAKINETSSTGDNALSIAYKQDVIDFLVSKGAVFNE